MNDAIRGAIGAQLHEKHMTRADLARAVGKTPQEVTRALNGSKGGGQVPPLWAAMLDAVGLTLVAVPVESNSAGAQLTLPSVSPADLESRVDEALQLLNRIKAGITPSSEDGDKTK